MFKTLPKIFSILISTSVWYSSSQAQIYLLKATCDFNIGIQERLIHPSTNHKGTTPISSKRERVISANVCVNQPVNDVGCYFEDADKSAMYSLALH